MPDEKILPSLVTLVSAFFSTGTMKSLRYSRLIREARFVKLFVYVLKENLYKLSHTWIGQLLYVQTIVKAVIHRKIIREHQLIEPIIFLQYAALVTTVAL